MKYSHYDTQRVECASGWLLIFFPQKASKTFSYSDSLRHPRMWFWIPPKDKTDAKEDSHVSWCQLAKPRRVHCEFRVSFPQNWNALQTGALVIKSDTAETLRKLLSKFCLVKNLSNGEITCITLDRGGFKHECCVILDALFTISLFQKPWSDLNCTHWNKYKLNISHVTTNHDPKHRSNSNR